MSNLSYAASWRERSEAAHGRRPVGLKERLSLMLEISRERRALARADEKTLSDLGLTRDEAEAEARRPFWDVPVGR